MAKKTTDSSKSAAKSKAAKPKAKATKPKAAAAKAEAAPKKSRKAAGGKKAAPQITMTLSHDEIAQKAYEIWLEKGRPVGLDEANWAEAEAALSK